ncbi:hypothetical protein K443DRAFT_115642, partial [Laccaria amethystina LaAM-08-1]
IILRYRRPQLFPSAPFFLTYRILYAKALYPYQFSVTADLSSEVRPASSFIQRAKLTLRCSYAHNRPIKGSRTHLRTFRKLFLASWSPSSCQPVIRSHMSDLPVLLCTVLGHYASCLYAFRDDQTSPAP